MWEVTSYGIEQITIFHFLGLKNQLCIDHKGQRSAAKSFIREGKSENNNLTLQVRVETSKCYKNVSLAEMLKLVSLMLVTRNFKQSFLRY